MLIVDRKYWLFGIAAGLVVVLPAYLAIMLITRGVLGETYVAHRYSVSNENIAFLRSYASAKVAMGDLTLSEGARIGCGLFDRLVLPKGESFPEYVRQALIDELRGAGLYSTDSPNILSGQIDKIENLIPSTWGLTATFTFADNESMTVHGLHKGESQVWFDCIEPAETLGLAVENLLSNLYHQPTFVDQLVNP
jgi:hypothetical protein